MQEAVRPSLLTLSTSYEPIDCPIARIAWEGLLAELEAPGFSVCFAASPLSFPEIKHLRFA